MAAWVVPLDLGVVWDSGAPEAVLAVNDMGDAALALRPRWDDGDNSAVVLVWSGSRYSSMGDPNDEAANGHRLYGKGLEDVLWIGEVHDSELIVALERQNSVHPRHDPSRFANLVHHVVRTKEQAVEVVASAVAVKRVPGSPGEAVMKALRPYVADGLS